MNGVVSDQLIKHISPPGESTIYVTKSNVKIYIKLEDVTYCLDVKTRELLRYLHNLQRSRRIALAATLSNVNYSLIDVALTR